jgi:hypothetical protein
MKPYTYVGGALNGQQSEPLNAKPSIYRDKQGTPLRPSTGDLIAKRGGEVYVRRSWSRQYVWLADEQ